MVGISDILGGMRSAQGTVNSSSAQNMGPLGGILSSMPRQSGYVSPGQEGPGNRQFGHYRPYNKGNQDNRGPITAPQSQSTSIAPLAGIANAGTGGLDPINMFQTAVQDFLQTTPSPLDYKYYRTAAEQDPNYQGFLQNGGVTNPYTINQDLW